MNIPTKIALVTGGNSGIGFAAARILAQKNCDVFIVGRNAEATRKAAQELGCTPIIADLSDTACIGAICEPFLRTGLDFLVNNAAISHYIPIADISMANIEEHFSVNVYSPLLLIKSLLPALKCREGSVTNVSSLVTARSFANFSIYAATKSALEAITKCLAIELAPENVRVNAICPGAVDTAMFGKSKFPDGLQQQVEVALQQMIPLHRRATPGEIAEVIYAQLTNAYTTGSIWNVDGGVGA